MVGSRRVNKKKYMNKTKRAKHPGSKFNANIGKLMKISQLPILKGALIMKGHIVAKGGSAGVMSKTLKKAVRFADNVLDSVNGKKMPKKITGGEDPVTPSVPSQTVTEPTNKVTEATTTATEPMATVTEVSPEVIDAVVSKTEETIPEKENAKELADVTPSEEKDAEGSIIGEAEEQHKFVPTSCGITDIYKKRDLYEDTLSTVVSVTPEKGGSKKKRGTRKRGKP